MNHAGGSEGSRPSGRRRRPWRLALGAVAVLVVVAVVLWGALLGFRRVSHQAVDAVHVAENGRDLTVLYIGSSPGCGDPYGVEVREDAETVTVSVSGRMLVPLFLPGCDDMGNPMVSTVRLAEPLGDRTVRDGTRALYEVRVVRDAPLGDLFTG